MEIKDSASSMSVQELSKELARLSKAQEALVTEQRKRKMQGGEMTFSRASGQAQSEASPKLDIGGMLSKANIPGMLTGLASQAWKAFTSGGMGSPDVAAKEAFTKPEEAYRKYAQNLADAGVQLNDQEGASLQKRLVSQGIERQEAVSRANLQWAGSSAMGSLVDGLTGMDVARTWQGARNAWGAWDTRIRTRNMRSNWYNESERAGKIVDMNKLLGE